MGEDFAQKFQEIFHCTVKGADIVEARLNAWNAFDTARGILPTEQWKLSQMQHDLEIGEDSEGKPIAYVVCDAIWIFDPDADSDGGKHAELLGPSPNNDGSDSVEPEKLLAGN